MVRHGKIVSYETLQAERRKKHNERIIQASQGQSTSQPVKKSEFWKNTFFIVCTLLACIGLTTVITLVGRLF